MDGSDPLPDDELEPPELLDPPPVDVARVVVVVAMVVVVAPGCVVDEATVVDVVDPAGPDVVVAGCVVVVVDSVVVVVDPSRQGPAEPVNVGQSGAVTTSVCSEAPSKVLEKPPVNGTAAPPSMLYVPSP